MELHFCDLCNESVPAGHLLDGRAFRRKGRVVCASCDAAMGGGSAAESTPPAPFAATAPTGPGHATPVTPLPHVAAPQVAHEPARRRNRPRGTSVLAGFAFVLALVAIGGSSFGIYRLMQESNQQKRNLRDGHAGLALKLEHLDGRMDGVVAGVAGQVDTVQSNLSDSFSTVALELTTKMRELKESLAARDERLDALETTLRAMDADLHATDEEIQTRLDSLMVASLEEREELTMLADRLAALDDLVHSGALLQPATADAPVAGPAWEVALDDLANEDSAVRWNAVQALAESGDPAVVPHLLPLLDDEDIWVRMAAAGALGDLGAVEAVSGLIRTLEDPETAVRERAMLSLRAITGRSFQFDPSGSESERAKVVKKWSDWWKKSRPSLAD